MNYIYVLLIILTTIIYLIFPSSLAAKEDLSLCKQGWSATQSGDHNTAITLYNSCIENGGLSMSSLARTYRNIGIAYRRKGEPRKAVEAYDKALSLKPADSWNDYVNRGNAWSDLGEYEKALHDYDLALASKPNDKDAFYNRGVVFERQGELEKAKADFIKAYEQGLRSRLLQQSLAKYGLLKERTSLVTDLPQPPSGYSWARCDEINGAFLRPEGWHFKKQRENDIWGYFITKENIDIEGKFSTGLTVNVIPNIPQKTGYSPSQYAEAYIKEGSSKKEVIRNLWSNSNGPFKSFGVALRNPASKTGAYITHHLAIGNDTTGTLFIIIFEGPEDTWESAWKIGEPMLKQFLIDSDI